LVEQKHQRHYHIIFAARGPPDIVDLRAEFFLLGCHAPLDFVGPGVKLSDSGLTLVEIVPVAVRPKEVVLFQQRHKASQEATFFLHVLVSFAFILQYVGKAGAHRIFTKAFDGDLHPEEIGIGGATKPPTQAAQEVLLCHSCFPCDAALTRS